jgi:hypothetical protein
VQNRMRVRWGEPTMRCWLQPNPLVFRIKTIKIPGNGQHCGGAAQSVASRASRTPPSRRRDRTLDGRRWEEGVATPAHSEESRHTDTR